LNLEGRTGGLFSSNSFLILIALVIGYLCASCSGAGAAVESPLPPSHTVSGLISPTATVAAPTATPVPTASSTPLPSPTPTEVPVSFAVIGDYGGDGPPERDVAAMVQSWDPDFVITTGDNNYPNGGWDTIDHSIGQYYHQFIQPYQGEYGQGADVNRFFPTLGNHDWNTDSAQPYLEYFQMPGNERYYDFVWGPLHFFALDSDSREPDGVGSSSVQAGWLKQRLAASQSPWNVVYMHHPPYSSGLHGSVAWTRWPYREWGASVVLAGHDHTYERLMVDGLLYFVNGLGGGSIYHFEDILPGSQARYSDDYGAMRVEATSQWVQFQFVNRRGQVIDEARLP
jgi:tartrate-resistant acid phosphatase type 5